MLVNKQLGWMNKQKGVELRWDEFTGHANLYSEGATGGVL